MSGGARERDRALCRDLDRVTAAMGQRRGSQKVWIMGKKMTRGERNAQWIEKWCKVPEGSHVGRPVKLRGWQRDEIKRIYDNPARTRIAILSFGRKNGKTALAAFLLLVHLCGPEARPNSQLFSAAQSREQAAILFALAAKIIRMSPELGEHVTIRDNAKQLHCPELGTLYRALSAEASTAYGLSPAFVVHDELGQVKGPRSELYEALETATAAQEQPLTVIISTQAPTDGDLLSMLIDDAQASNDPRTVVSLYTAPMDLDPFSEEAVRAANPAFGDFQTAEEVMGMAEAARRMPSREPSYRNLVLNQRVDMNSPFVPPSIWKENGARPLEDLRGLAVYGGLDLASVRDLAALVLIALHDRVWQVHCRFWLPKHGLVQKAKDDRVPYDTWEKQGHLLTTPGKAIDYEYIAGELRKLFDELDIMRLGFDRWNFRHLRPWLQKAGFSDDELERFEEFGQGYQSMTPALRTLETDLLHTKLAHGMHPVLTMCAANARVESDPAGNRKLTKAKSFGRIDGMVALAMARGVAGSDEVRSDGWVQGGLIVL
jgi:phage terminase large subunit-like protein